MALVLRREAAKYRIRSHTEQRKWPIHVNLGFQRSRVKIGLASVLSGSSDAMLKLIEMLRGGIGYEKKYRRS